MKKLLIFCLFVIGMAVQARAQVPIPTFSEIFFQGSTQKKYLKKQIAQLQIYLIYLQKGYDIAQEGLATIHSIKNGEFDLHNIFYTSLKQVNPNIKKFSEVAATIGNEVYVIGQAKKFTHMPAGASAMTAEDILAMSNTCSVVLSDCERVLVELSEVTTPGKLEMTDDERLERIHKLYSYSVAQSAFVQKYRAQTTLYALSRTKEHQQLDQLEDLYNK